MKIKITVGTDKINSEVFKIMEIDDEYELDGMDESEIHEYIEMAGRDFIMDKQMFYWNWEKLNENSN